MYVCLYFFFFNDTATTEIYTLSLHDALPILDARLDVHKILGLEEGDAHVIRNAGGVITDAIIRIHVDGRRIVRHAEGNGDRKSTRLNSSHANISYAVFCLKKKKKNTHVSVYI